MLGLGIMIAYHGLATAGAGDIRRLIQDFNESYKNQKDDAIFYREFGDCFDYSSKSKELSIR